MTNLHFHLLSQTHLDQTETLDPLGRLAVAGTVSWKAGSGEGMVGDLHLHRYLASGLLQLDGMTRFHLYCCPKQRSSFLFFQQEHSAQTRNLGHVQSSKLRQWNGSRVIVSGSPEDSAVWKRGRLLQRPKTNSIRKDGCRGMAPVCWRGWLSCPSCKMGLPGVVSQICPTGMICNGAPGQ